MIRQALVTLVVGGWGLVIIVSAGPLSSPPAGAPAARFLRGGVGAGAPAARFLRGGVGAGAPSRAFEPVGAEQPVSFARDIQPILRQKCLTCHGELRTSGLDLRTREGALKGGDNGAALVPGKADESRLYRLVAGLEQPSMPIDGALSPQEIGTIKAWIDQGAHWEGDPTAPADPPREAVLAALENATIPPAARNYWAFKLPVQARGSERVRALRASDRSLPRAGAPGEGPRAGAARAALHAAAPRLPRSDRPAADPGRDRGVSRRHRPGRLGAADRHAARLAALRRALGPPLARCRALRRFERLRARLRPAERLALSRLRDPRVQPGQAVQRVPEGADRRRRARREDRRDADRHRLPARRRRGWRSARRTIRSAATSISTT